MAEKSASVDNAPVLICSDLPESNHMPMPTGSVVKDSAIFAPLSYYPLSVPVVPLPRALNEEALQAGSRFLQEAKQRHERFFWPSHSSRPTKHSIGSPATQHAEGYDRVHELRVFDRVKAMEFVPRTSAKNSP